MIFVFFDVDDDDIDDDDDIVFDDDDDDDVDNVMSVIFALFMIGM